MTTSWPTWIQLEQYSALHNIPFATKANGFDGLDAELRDQQQAACRSRSQRLLDMAKDGHVQIRRPRQRRPTRCCCPARRRSRFNSSGDARRPGQERQIRLGAERTCRTIRSIIKTPINSIIGGASLWAMTAPNRTPAEYKAVAQFLEFLGQPENDAAWHQHTGYVPVTLAGFELSKQQGFYTRIPAPTCRSSS